MLQKRGRKVERPVPNQFPIRAGDKVLVVRGGRTSRDGSKTDKDRPEVAHGKKVYKGGIVKEVLRRQNRVIVTGRNIIKKHVGANRDPQNRRGGILEMEGSIHISNVMLEDPKTGEPTRVGYRFVEDRDGKRRKERYAKRSGELIPDRKPHKK
ncbi:50S ribosomal protein L24 [Pasteuria penetrans]|uniref:50S ribosomal protein L24 n=1 Tax=Pasteuria penetrans TaxID=86005 RepID=UPI000FC25C07|nr:50S ribosomal protein L24 [Pasteuria penetrans]